jgi:hypothetical protein
MVRQRVIWIPHANPPQRVAARPAQISLNGGMLLKLRDPTNAERSRRAREKAKAGLRVFAVTLAEVALVEELIVTGKLDPDYADDHETVCRALQQAIEEFVFGKMKNDNSTS